MAAARLHVMPALACTGGRPARRAAAPVACTSARRVGPSGWGTQPGARRAFPLPARQTSAPHRPRGGALAVRAAAATGGGVVGKPFCEFEHAGGMVHILELSNLSLKDDNGQPRHDETRLVRVWLPPGYAAESAPEGGYPVLYLQDGQNCYEDYLSFSGCSWRAALTAHDLISSGQVPPFVIVAVDHAGPLRSYDYLPVKPGVGDGNFRPEAAGWPGGGIDGYLASLVGEIMPHVREKFAITSNPERVAFGGSSFGGICALCACLKYPGLFQGALVESPSFWHNEGGFLATVGEYAGPWPAKVYVGMGTREHSGRGAEAPDVDAKHIGYAKECARLLGEQGVSAENGRLQLVFGEGQAHTESAWMERLPGALKFLMADW